ncbi:hypothetical protein HLH34_04335 [Gluconacetobacter azotocaptans]|uniref:Uncharacterized protein n=1 Tax=Gluconacetobacter azotocaptans TaxID=142834 RepID=A0A7W4PCF0_9PROT|nr:helix-turn-helix domain-containing protein [Gluconacetobacter azotocaptans]MBB2189192.1 hypothetical protein [Gluconacetobacter azotocaptans]GBQ32201.1 hypothetical protein AA13594_2300 [Gluconacetobacter azotocaptans DSM 13594]
MKAQIDWMRLGPIMDRMALDGASVPAIAAALGVSARTVRGRLADARGDRIAGRPVVVRSHPRGAFSPMQACA